MAFTPHDPEPPAQHIRNGLVILDELQREILKVGLRLGQAGETTTYELLKLLAAAQHRLWTAVRQLEEKGGTA